MQNKIDYKLSDMILYHKNEQAKDYIKNNSIDINAQDQMGFSYLHCAVTRKNNDIIDFLLESGINIDIQDEYGKTPLTLAIIQYGGDDSIIRHLIAKGADMTIRTTTGKTPFDLARTVGVPEDILNMLEEASGHCEDKKVNVIHRKNNELGETEDLISDYFSFVKKDKAIIKEKFDNKLVYADEQCDLGVEYCKKQDFNNARKCFEIAAEAGSSTALGNLGLIYLKGYGVDKNEKKSFEYFRLSAEQGNTMAMSQVSDMYRLGVGVRKNVAKSNYWKMLSSSPEKYSKRKDEIGVKLDVFVRESNTLDAIVAEKRCTEIIELIPDPQTMYEETAIAYYTLGTIFEKKGNYMMALEAYKQAILVSCVKNNPIIPYRIGCCYYHMKNEIQAKIFFKKAYKLGKKNVFEIDNCKYFKYAK